MKRGGHRPAPARDNRKSCPTQNVPNNHRSNSKNNKSKMVDVSPPPPIKKTNHAENIFQRETEIILDRHYGTIKECLGRGNFSQVYLLQGFGKRVQAAALKIAAEEESNEVQVEGVLLKSIHHYEKNMHHFPTIYNYGSFYIRDRKFRYCLIQLLGKNLVNLKTDYCKDRKFSPSTLAHIAVETFEAIWHLHNLGFGHHDIKPQSFVCGRMPEEARIYLVGYGNVRYVFHGETFVKPTSEYRFSGTMKYCSMNAHRKKHPDLTDDLESWIYMMFELYYEGCLLWKATDPPEEIAAAKLVFLRDCEYAYKEVPDVYKKMVHYVKGSEYGKKPDHKMLFTLLKDFCKTQGGVTRSKVEWNKSFGRVWGFRSCCRPPLHAHLLWCLKHDDWHGGDKFRSIKQSVTLKVQETVNNNETEDKNGNGKTDK